MRTYTHVLEIFRIDNAVEEVKRFVETVLKKKTIPNFFRDTNLLQCPFARKDSGHIPIWRKER